MKNTLPIILSGLLLCGCSQKDATSARQAIDLVEAGKDVAWHDGSVLHVTSRDGTSLRGIQITTTASDGQKTIITADIGTLMPNGADNSSVKIILNNATVEKHSEAGKKVSTAQEMSFVLHD